MYYNSLIDRTKEEKMKIEIFATFDGEERICGYHECETALEAVILEISNACPDTADADSISAGDDDMNVTAFKLDGGHEIHIYVDNEDIFFFHEA